MKQIGGLRKVKLRGLAKVEWAAYNLLRIPKLRAKCAQKWRPDVLRGGSDRRQQGISRENIH